MSELRYTLLADGPSDNVLQYHLTWLLRQHLIGGTAVSSEWADLRSVSPRPKGLVERIRFALELYPCDILFVHRDAEREPRQSRLAEIESAWAAQSEMAPPIVCVVPVRMQEAWLLFDESAIRTAAGNPNGSESLALPKLHEVEQLADPKERLYQLLRDASGHRGRRLQKFAAQSAARRVGELIDDFAPLRRLSAFKALEEDLLHMLIRLHRALGPLQ